jgi:hypothetical protein
MYLKCGVVRQQSLLAYLSLMDALNTVGRNNVLAGALVVLCLTEFGKPMDPHIALDTDRSYVF